MEALQIVIFAGHHARVDVAEPPRRAHDEAQSEDTHKEEGVGGADEQIAGADDEHRAEEGCHLDGYLHAVLEVALARHLLLQGQRLLVVDGQLEDDEVDESAREEHVGAEHEEGELAREDGGHHYHEGDDEGCAVEAELGLEQGDDVLAMGHQQIDVVALLAHDLDERGDAVEGKAVEAPEVGHQRIVVDVGIGDERGEDDDEHDAHDGALAHHLVAQVGLQFEFQVFADGAEAVEETERRDALEFGLLLLGDFFVDVLELEVAVDEEQGCNSEDDGREEPPGVAGSLQGIERLVKHLPGLAEQQRHVGDGIEQDGGHGPEHAAIDEGAEEKIDLAVEHDEQFGGYQHAEHAEDAGTARKSHDGVGDEHGEPEEIVAADVGRQEEALDGREARDGQQDVGLDHHGGGGLEDEAQQEVDGQDEDHKRDHRACIALGGHADDGPIYNKVYGKHAAADVHQQLGPLVLLEGRIALVTQLDVLAQQAE